MQKKLSTALITVLFVLLPFISGCQGSSSASGLGSLFGSSSGSGSSGGEMSIASLDGSSGGESGGDSGVTSSHNPEPSTMLLLGSGMMAMAYFKKKKR